MIWHWFNFMISEVCKHWFLLQKFWKQSTLEWNFLLHRCLFSKVYRWQSQLKSASSRTEPHKFSDRSVNGLPCPRETELSSCQCWPWESGTYPLWGQLKRMGNAQCGCCFPTRCYSVKSGTSCEACVEQLFVPHSYINLCCLETRL